MQSQSVDLGLSGYQPDSISPGQLYTGPTGTETSINCPGGVSADSGGIMGGAMGATSGANTRTTSGYPGQFSGPSQNFGGSGGTQGHEHNGPQPSSGVPGGIPGGGMALRIISMTTSRSSQKQLQ